MFALLLASLLLFEVSGEVDSSFVRSVHKYRFIVLTDWANSLILLTHYTANLMILLTHWFCLLTYCAQSLILPTSWFCSLTDFVHSLILSIHFMWWPITDSDHSLIMLTDRLYTFVHLLSQIDVSAQLLLTGCVHPTNKRNHTPMMWFVAKSEWI